MIAPLLLAASQTLTFSADRIAADNVTHAAVATGHVVAAYGPLTIRGERMERDADGLMHFHDPVCATTCTNEVGHTHWSVSGEIEYKERDYVLLRNMRLHFCEFPVLWLPYLYYPLDWDCGFSWMPGYTGRWGAYLLTRYKYHLLGASSHEEGRTWLDGATRFDMRYKQGLALGEDLTWNLGDFGAGRFNAYYAWDDYTGKYNDPKKRWRYDNWGSEVNHDRYAFGLAHRWEATERDSVRVQGALYSDSHFRRDYYRSTLLNAKWRHRGYDSNGLFWEHVENSYAFGAEVSGRLNDFYGATDRLPELYLDVNPQPVLGLPVNYESATRIGYLKREAAEYGRGDRTSVFAFVPGLWADYEAFRLDTYHRITAPFKTLDDVMSVVPRLGYRGTYWSEIGQRGFSGWEKSRGEGDACRSIVEGGVTFAARGTGWIDDRWRHMVEPYFDVLAQEALYSGTGGRRSRPYVFDSADESVMWEDQFAGRSRNLPYSYYGVTPGVRNAWDKADERGKLRQVADVDLYAAVQFNRPDNIWGEEGTLRQTRAGTPHYGRAEGFVMPGFRARCAPDDDLTLLSRMEYDSDHNTIASADAGFKHALTKKFSYNAKYGIRDYRMWDFAPSPSDRGQMTDGDFNYAKFHFVQVGLEHQPIDWLAFAPYVRWDIRDNEVDSVGTWIDYLTDCLGFRFLVEYQNSYTRVDGYEHDDDWSVGFYIYLRALGADNGGILIK